MSKALKRTSQEVATEAPLAGLWPKEPWLFGEVLAIRAQEIISPASPLRYDQSFLMGVMRLVLDAAERAQGEPFKPRVDIVIIADGAQKACLNRPNNETQEN